MQRILLIVGSLAVLSFTGIMVLSSCNKYRNKPYLCFLQAQEIAGKFVAKKGKDFKSCKAVGTFEFNVNNALLYVYYAGKKGPGSDFMIELDLNTCKPRFSDKVKTEIPKIAEIANKLMLEKGRNLNMYEIPQIDDDAKEWYVLYRKCPPRGFDDSPTVLISKKNYKAILLRALEVPPDNWDS
ncbi:MAG: hypothetical protein HY796_00115 [Elusimicrobia bacterium]|nr:hypothetical protein [Elusimicrobiota bacterium]